jgi:hypothetical protein
MRRVIGSIIVLFLLGGLFVKYRDGRSLMARPGTQGTANAGDVLSDPPNWKVEPANPSSRSRSPNRISTPPRSTVAIAKYGSNSVNGSNPPTWSRRKGVFPPAAPAYLPRDSSIVPPHATVLSKPAQQPAIPPTPKPASDQSVVTTPGRPNARVSGGTTHGPDAVALEEYRVLLHHAQFLIKAGLAPMAKEPLQQILRGAPGTPIAREARLTLDTIRN